MVFLKGKQGVCFDVPTASVTEVQETWHDSRCWQISVATEQPSQKDHGKDITTSKDSGKAIQASGDSKRETEVSGDSWKEVVASEDSDQEVATKITHSKTKARSGVLIKILTVI